MWVWVTCVRVCVGLVGKGDDSCDRSVAETSLTLKFQNQATACPAAAVWATATATAAAAQL